MPWTRPPAIAAWPLLVVAIVVSADSVAAQKRGLLTVTARDDEGKPLGFVDVTIYQADEYIVERSTDSNGLAILPAPPGTIRIRTSHVSYRTRVLTVSSPTGDGALTITLTKKPPEPEPEGIDFSGGTRVAHRTGAIAGRVLAPDGRPVANVTVHADGANSVTTDDEGAFFVSVPVPESGQVRVTASPHSMPITTSPIPETREIFESTDFPTRVSVVAERVTSGIKVVLKSRHYVRLTLHVTDEHGKVPNDANVLIINNSDRNREERSEWRVPEDGVVETLVSAGRLTIIATGGGRQIEHYRAVPQFSYGVYDGSARFAVSTTAEVGDEPPPDVYVTLIPGADVRGRVVFQGLQEAPRTVRPMRVYAYPGTGMTESEDDPNGRIARDGSFHLEGLAGSQCLKVFRPYDWHLLSVTHHGIDITSEPLIFGPSEHVDDIVITLGPEPSGPGSTPCEMNVAR
jgi:hypothetical protein